MDDSQSENQQFSHQPLEYEFSHIATKLILETGSSNKCGTWYLFSLATETSFVRRRGGISWHSMWPHLLVVWQRNAVAAGRWGQVQVHGRAGEGGDGPKLPLLALSGPCIPGLGRGHGAKTCHLGSNSGITGSCARSNFTHFGFDRFLAPLQVVYGW